jgi:hypothetical protein
LVGDALLLPVLLVVALAAWIMTFMTEHGARR